MALSGRQIHQRADAALLFRSLDGQEPPVRAEGYFCTGPTDRERFTPRFSGGNVPQPSFVHALRSEKPSIGPERNLEEGPFEVPRFAANLSGQRIGDAGGSVERPL